MRFGTTFLCAILLVKLGAAPVQIAEYETFLWLSGMFTFFWVGGSVNAMLSIAKNASQKSTFLNAAAWLLLQAIVAAAIVILIPSGNSQIKVAAATFIVLNTVSFLNEYLLFSQHKNKQLLMYAIAVSLLQLAAVVLPFVFSSQIYFSIIGLIAVAAIKLLLLLLLLKQAAAFQFSIAEVKMLAVLSAPLSLGILVSGSAEYVDGFLVKYFFNDAAFALFRYGSRELPLSLILANTLSTLLIVTVAQNKETGLAELKRKSLQLAHLLFPASIVLMLFTKPLLSLLYSNTYTEASGIFRIMLLLVIPRLLFPQTVITALKLNRYILLSATIELLLNIACSLLLLQFLGIEGIVYGTLIAYTFDKLFLAIVLKKKASISIYQYVALKPFLLYSILLVIAFIAAEIFL